MSCLICDEDKCHHSTLVLDKNDYLKVQARIKELLQTTKSSSKVVASLEGRIESLESENKKLKEYKRWLEADNKTLIDANKSLLETRLAAHKRIKELEAELEDRMSNIKELEGVAESWMKDCETLKDKYESWILAPSGPVNKTESRIHELEAELEKERVVVDWYSNPGCWFEEEKPTGFSNLIESSDVEDIGTTTIYEVGGKRARQRIKERK